MEHPIVALQDVPETGSIRAGLFERPVLVTRVEGAPRAYVDSCPHLGGPLDRKGERLVCAWHGAEFSLDGRCLQGPAHEDSRAIVLPTRVIDGVITYVYSPEEGRLAGPVTDILSRGRPASPNGSLPGH